MLLGEHSVVFGAPAIVAALEQRIYLEITARQDREVHIFSELANWKTTLDELADHPYLRFVLTSLRKYQNQLTFGLDIKIDSEFPADWGLGSSAAIVAAMVKILDLITSSTKKTLWQEFEAGRQIILAVQGRGSGADLAASLAGGLVYFSPTEQLIAPLPSPTNLNMTLIYSGYKTPTPEVLQKVSQAWEAKPQELTEIYQQMEQVTKSAYKSLSNQDLTSFYQTINDYQELMRQLGVSDSTLDKIIAENSNNHPYPAKISGSGLGDCVLSFNQNAQISGFENLPIQLTQQGAVAQLINE